MCAYATHKRKHNKKLLLYNQIAARSLIKQDMARGAGKVNNNDKHLIDVVEEKLPQGALGWQEVAALYQVRTQEQVLRDHEDVKRYWAEKLCNRFKKPTGNPGDPNRDRILCCQRIHQSILAKSSSLIMGAGSSNEDNKSDDDEEAEDEDEDEDEDRELLAEVAGISTTTNLTTDTMAPSRATTPTTHYDTTLTGAAIITTTAAELIDNFASISAAADVSTRNPAAAAAATTLTSRKKMKRRAEEVLASTPFPTSEKTKNSGSEKRGSIVKSIEKLTTSIAADENNNNQGFAATAAALSQMQMQMQQMSFSMQQQMTAMQRFMKRVEKKEK
jgi:hypothetical protein